MLKDIPSIVYKGISFSKGSKPNFDTLPPCFIEKGLFVNNKGNSPVIMSVSDYIFMLNTNVDNGNIVSIEETELSNNVSTFGGVAQISSEYKVTFEGKNGLHTRFGINLFQLIEMNGKWLISSMCWDDRSDKSLLG